MQTAISAADPTFTGHITVTYNTTTNRFVFQWDGLGGAAQIQIPFLGNTVTASTTPLTEMAPYVGVTSLLSLTPSTPISALSPPSLSGPDSVYLQSNFIASNYTVRPSSFT